MKQRPRAADRAGVVERARVVRAACIAGAACTLVGFAACGPGGSTAPPPDASFAAGDAANDGGADAPDSEGPADSSSLPDDLGSPNDAADGQAAAPDSAPIVANSPPTFGFLRFANWSPDSPAVDACIAVHGTGAFTGPLVAQFDEGGGPSITFPLVSAYFDLAPAQYDVRFVAAGATSCAVGVTADATAVPKLAAGAAETVALVGELQPGGGDPSLGYAAFADDVTSSAAVAIRFVNAAPALAEVDVGTGTLTAMNFATFFADIPFGHASKAQEVPMTDASAPSVDANGYLSLKSLSNVTLSAHAPGATTDSVSVPGLFTASGSILTIAVVGDTYGGTPAGLVECVDNAANVTAFSNCTVIAIGGDAGSL